MKRYLSQKLIFLGVALVAAAPILAAGCDARPQSRNERPEPVEKHEADHEEVHLGEAMNELARRFSAIWFAGKAGNDEMVDYQIHEIEELVEELEPATPHENGIDVVERLEADILAGLEDVEKAVDASDSEAFETSYRRVMNSCGGCHQNTGHGFIQPKIPDYNPYPNLDLTGRD